MIKKLVLIVFVGLFLQLSLEARKQNVVFHISDESCYEQNSISDLQGRFADWGELLALKGQIGDEIFPKQFGDDATELMANDNTLIVYEKKNATLSAVPIWQEEAENALLSGTVEITTGCANASQGAFVKLKSDAGNAILFENIMMEKEGSYKLVIDYYQVSETRLEMVVNDISRGEILFPAAQWCYQGPAAQYSTAIDLIEGSNKIELKVIGGLAGPFVDRLMLLDPDYLQGTTTYFVSSSDGDDTNNGLSTNTPFKSLKRISSVHPGPGDSVLFKSGDKFGGQLVINGSGSKDSVIVIGRYGQGAKPIIDGAGTEGGDHLASILINNNDHIEVRDLEITNDRRISRSGVSDELAYGIYVHNSGTKIMQHFVFKNLTIKDIFAISIEGVEFNAIKVAAIRIHSERNIVAGLEKHIRDVLVDSCFITKTTRYGIYSSHAGGEEGIGNDSLNRNMNLVFKNNHFFHTGGSCITPGRSYNCLLENNIFEYPGSDIDPRMANRGSAAWFWNCRNVVAQYNRTYHVRGYADSYGMHIDFGNENVVFQYNYSEDSEGGFAEILGSNLNSVYRFNVSVNDGFRNNKGNTLWVSDFAGSSSRIRSQGNYIYNNSIYVDEGISPDIDITGKDTYIYNNIFYAIGASIIGQEVKIDISDGSDFKMSNNLYFGNVSSAFSKFDSNPVFGDPEFEVPGSQNQEGYRISSTSPALTSGTSFEEPAFPAAGKGIFKDMTVYPEYDLFGNPVKIRTHNPSIGVYNGNLVSTQTVNAGIAEKNRLSIHPNPVKDILYLTFFSDRNETVIASIRDLKGRNFHSFSLELKDGENMIEISVKPDLRNGIYVFNLMLPNGKAAKQAFVLFR